MKKLIFLTIAIALSFLLASCNDDNANDIQKGTLKLSITDAPLDTD
jgi:predicted small secreted protein